MCLYFIITTEMLQCDSTLTDVSPPWEIVELGNRDCPLAETVTASPPLNMSSFTLSVSGTSSPGQTVMIMSKSCGTAS